jgi:hypothetical protein
MGKAGDLVRRCAAELDEFKNFAATDLRTYDRIVNPKARRAAEDRYDEFVRRGKAPQPWMPPSSWSLSSLRAGYRQVEAARAGSCTDFGVACAYLLGSASEGDRRFGQVHLEIVSWRRGAAAHTYVVVGRNGDLERDAMLPEMSTWKGQNGDAWYVVDGWAGAMGYDVIYRKASHFPFDGMTHPLSVVLSTG